MDSAKEKGVQDLEDFGVEIIQGAGKEALALYGKGTTRVKFDENLVTEAELRLNEYFQDKLSLEQAITSIKQQTRNYAKRQLTWFRKEPIDFTADISGNTRGFFGEILFYLEGRLSEMSNY